MKASPEKTDSTKLPSLHAVPCEPCHNPQAKPGDYFNGNAEGVHIKSDEECDMSSAKNLANITDHLNDRNIDLAVRSLDARKFLAWHVDHVRNDWMEWAEASSKVLEDIRQTRVAIGIESRLLLAECADVRKFFLAEEHTREINRLREFIELAERLRSLKQDGTLDQLADLILKLT